MRSPPGAASCRSASPTGSGAVQAQREAAIIAQQEAEAQTRHEAELLAQREAELREAQ